MDCETNDCRKEKRGCKGCYYNESEGNMSDKNIDKDIEIIRREQNDVIEVRDIVDEGSSLYNECEEFIQAVDNVLSELEIKDKMIDLMAKQIDNYDAQLNISYFKRKEYIIEHFRNEVLKDE